MRIPTLASALLIVMGTTACIGDDAPSQAPGEGLVTVYEHGPHRAQCEPIALTPAQSAAKLGNAGVGVERTSCGFIENVAYPAVCGGGTPEIIVHDIDAADLLAAEAAGFADTASLSQWRRETCAPYLRAVQIAQQDPPCSATRNRVLQIQRGSDADHRWALHDQADLMCHDASFRQQLFGAEGDEPLCTHSDSIAGPQKSCVDGAPAEMFDIIIGNLDKPDLGLGSQYEVTQVFP